MKRFYKIVSTATQPHGIAILLDGKVLKTPLKTELLAPTQKIAQAIMSEWAVQITDIKPDTMPVTQWLTTCQDMIIERRAVVIDALLDYIDTDFICYRAGHEPYNTRQNENWNPTIEWLQAKFKVQIETTVSLNPLQQSEKLHEGLRDYINNLDNFKLTLLQSLVDDTGSIFLSVAFLEQAITAESLWQAVFVDDMVRAEIYHEDKYGAAPDQDKKRENLKRNFDAIAEII